MTKERFEDLLKVGVSEIYGPDHWKVYHEDFAKFLTAVYPLIRDDVIEEIEIDLENCMGCAINADDQEVSQYYRNVEELRDYIRALKSKDTKL